MGLLASLIVVEDLRKLEIAAIPVLALSAIMVAYGFFFPLDGLQSHHALAGAALGLFMGTITRAYIHWRTGVAAFGGADIAMICGAGGLVGPFLFGPWLFVAALTGALLAVASPFFLRSENVDGEEMNVLPFCPALILSAALTFALSFGGVIQASGPF